jgi:hypothetical protein
MRANTIGILLIIIGTCMMIYTGFNYVTTKNVVDLGPIQVNQQVNHPVNWSPYVGVILLAGGIIVIISGRKIRA